MKPVLDKLGSFGSVVAAAACPVCFPKLALIGAIFGLGAFGSYEGQLFWAAQALVVIAVLGHALAFLQHRRAWMLAAAALGGVAFFAGLYLLRSEAVVYAGLAALVGTSVVDLLRRLRRRAATSPSAPAP